MNRFVSAILASLTSFVLIGLVTLTAAPAAEVAPHLDVQRQGDVTYISGGVGDEEEAEIEALGQNFNLRVTLADKNSAWLSNVEVLIEDLKGNTLLDQRVVGPLLYVKLPNGKYTVTAKSSTGDTHTNTVWIDDVRQATSYFFLGREQAVASEKPPVAE